MVDLRIVVACDEQGTIGDRGGLPAWDLPGDLARFRALTMGSPVVMGGATFRSLPPKGLPGRHIVVVTRAATLDAPAGVVFAASVEDGLAIGRSIAERVGAPTVWIAGGASIYEATLDQADYVHLTLARGTYAGDVRIPLARLASLTEVSRQTVPARDDPTRESYSYVVLARRR